MSKEFFKLVIVPLHVTITKSQFEVVVYFLRCIVIFILKKKKASPKKLTKAQYTKQQNMKIKIRI